jgi:hypothetical protein
MTMTASALPKQLRLALILGGVSLCGACSSMENVISPSLNYKPAPVAAAQESRVSPSDKLVRLPLGPQDLDCPTVDVQDGAASLRVGGATNESVRYQFDLGQTARECDPVAGNQFSLKIGVSGHLLIGPAGQPGAYSAPLRITVRSESSQKPVYSKSYKIEANTGTATETPFQFVSDPIVLPMTRTELREDYSILIGFDNGRPTEVKHVRRRHAARKDAAH